jgi:zinc protease
MDAPIRYTLPNGLTVVLQRHRTAAVVAFQAWVHVGSADEPDELAGIAHVFEHMLFKGTERRGVGQIAQEVEGAGGEINAWTSFDQTVYHVVLASRFFDLALDILADALFHSSFDPVELERELKVVLEEVKQGEDNPGRVLTQALFANAYQKHPYRRPVIGYSRTVKSFTRERLLDFFQRHYVAGNMTLVVVGDFDPDVAKQKIAAAFGAAPGRPLPAPPSADRQEAEQRQTRSVVVTQEVREAQLSVAFHVPGLRHEDTAALDVASIVLGQGDSSRLTLTIKRGEQLVNEAYSYAYTPRDPGLFVVGASLQAEQLDVALAALLDQTFRLAHEEIGVAELRKAQSIIESDTVYQRETVQGLARKLGFFQTVTGELAYEDEYARQVRAVTPARVREVVARYLTAGNATVAVLLPKADETAADALEARLPEVVAHAAEAARNRVLEKPRARAGRVAQEPSDMVRTRLPSGVRLIVLRDPQVALVALRGVWLGGLRAEDEKNNGINNLLASLITRGTRSLSGDALAHEVEAMAGSIGGFSGRNSFGVRTELLARHFERGFELFADCVLHPELAEEEIEKERRQALEEIRTQDDNVASEAFRLFQQALYRTHPYRMDVHGTAQSVQSLTRRRLRDYYNKHMAPENLTLAIVGDIDPREAVRKAKELFAGKRARHSGKLVTVPRDRPPRQPLRVERFANKQQAHIVYGFPGTHLRDPDRYVLEVLATVLSGQGGRLFLELRDKRGLAYRVSAYSMEGIDPGYFAVYIATSPENVGVAVPAIEEELAKVIADPVPAAELDRAKRYLAGAHEISLQRRSALASTIAFNACYGHGWDEYRRYASTVLAVTAADVQRVARRILDPRRAVIATIRPEEAAEPAAAAAPKAARR